MARMRILAESLRPAERLPSPKLRRVGGTTGQMQLAPLLLPQLRNRTDLPHQAQLVLDVP
jgi:hypothetical protein